MTIYKVGDPDPTPELDRVGDYCWAPCRLVGRASTVYCSWPKGHTTQPHVAVDVRGGKGYIVAVFLGSDLPSGRVWSPRDSKPWVMGPAAMGISDGAWTDAMVLAGAHIGVYRQCSIGWHNECSDPEGEECRCACHADQDDGMEPEETDDDAQLARLLRDASDLITEYIELDEQLTGRPGLGARAVRDEIDAYRAAHGWDQEEDG